jgi:hypothetical protein
VTEFCKRARWIARFTAMPIEVDQPLRRAMLIDGGFAAKF